jgi:TonB family protein
MEMAARAQEQRRDQPSRRRGLRYRVQAPLDVTVLRSGIPDTLPGRSVNLGEGGISAIVAGELLPGETVGIEILLPLVDPLRTRALVRHHDKLRSGMEFVGLSLEQQAAIRDWAGQAKAEPELAVRPKVPIENVEGANIGRSGGGQPPASQRRSRTWIFFLLLAAILLAGLWWRWRRGWKELESDLPKNAEIVEAQRPELRVPSDVMERLVTHRVDPEYPAAGRKANLEGVIALDVVVGRDGSVVEIHPLNGPDVLAKAAMEALRWWRFEPYLVEGKAVVVETTVAVEFKP